jgi:hypothetical protein
VVNGVRNSNLEWLLCYEPISFEVIHIPSHYISFIIYRVQLPFIHLHEHATHTNIIFSFAYTIVALTYHSIVDDSTMDDCTSPSQRQLTHMQPPFIDTVKKHQLCCLHYARALSTAYRALQYSASVCMKTSACPVRGYRTFFVNDLLFVWRLWCISVVLGMIL